MIAINTITIQMSKHEDAVRKIYNMLLEVKTDLNNGIKRNVSYYGCKWSCTKLYAEEYKKIQEMDEITYEFAESILKRNNDKNKKWRNNIKPEQNSDDKQLMIPLSTEEDLFECHIAKDFCDYFVNNLENEQQWEFIQRLITIRNEVRNYVQG